MNSTRRFICICSGNICRSPMAVALLREKLDARSVPAVVISGGTLGIQGRRADPFARQAIAEHSQELKPIIDEHRSQGISAVMLQVADHIIVMAPRHERFVREMVGPKIEPKLVRLWAFAPRTSRLNKIPDPVGHDATVFRGCRDLIDASLDRWLDEVFRPRPVD